MLCRDWLKGVSTRRRRVGAPTRPSAVSGASGSGGTSSGVRCKGAVDPAFAADEGEAGVGLRFGIG